MHCQGYDWLSYYNVRSATGKDFLGKSNGRMYSSISESVVLYQLTKYNTHTHRVQHIMLFCRKVKRQLS